MREQVLMLRTEVQEGSHALQSLHDVISSGFRRLAKQNSLHQAKNQANFDRIQDRLAQLEMHGVKIDPASQIKSRRLREDSTMSEVELERLINVVLHETGRYMAEGTARRDFSRKMCECQICFEPYEVEGCKKPRSLPCHHVLCSACLNRCCVDGKVTRPHCRSQCSVAAQSGASVSSPTPVVDVFAPAYFHIELLEAEQRFTD